MEQDSELAAWERLFSITDSEFCSQDADTVLYKWDFKKFLLMERHVHFNEDRRLWAERGASQDRKIESEREKNRQRNHR